MVAKCHQSTLKYVYKYMYCFIFCDGKWFQKVTSPHLNIYINICIVLFCLIVNGCKMSPVHT